MNEMIDPELDRLSREIIQYATETQNYSYYDLYAYAYTDKNEWLQVFKNRRLRVFLSTYLKESNRRKKGHHTPTMAEAMDHFVAAQAAYLKKQSSVDGNLTENEVSE